jgi:hypothetical protein
MPKMLGRTIRQNGEKMKSQTISDDIDMQSYGFNAAKKALLEATRFAESAKHPVKRVKFKITFYWE